MQDDDDDDEADDDADEDNVDDDSGSSRSRSDINIRFLAPDSGTTNLVSDSGTRIWNQFMQVNLLCSRSSRKKTQQVDLVCTSSGLRAYLEETWKFRYMIWGIFHFLKIVANFREIFIKIENMMARFGEDWFGYDPRPGRVIFFKGNIWHHGSPPNKKYRGLRASLVYKTMRTVPLPSK